MTPTKQVDAQFPRKLSLLFRPSRYKVLHGGRGSGKSWGVARALLILAAQKPMRILCTREVQNSILESVHKLLSDQVETLGLSHFYEIQKTTIKGSNGSQFIFEGLRHNINSIKSMEGVDVCWVEEAEKVTDDSWRILIPTIRAPGSEIWVTFNPHLGDRPHLSAVHRQPAAGLPDCRP
jgi:phage terminase large subunit